MGSITVVFILLTTLVTAFISGIFGMAGGLILMAVLTALVSVAMAMVIHGTLQMVANGYRAFLLRDAMVWPVVRRLSGGGSPGDPGTEPRSLGPRPASGIRAAGPDRPLGLDPAPPA